MKYTCVCIALIVTLLFAGNIHGETMDGHTMHLDSLPDTTVFYAFALRTVRSRSLLIDSEPEAAFHNPHTQPPPKAACLDGFLCFRRRTT